MFKRFKLKRQIALTLIVTMVTQFIYAGVAFALGEGPAQPEALRFQPVDTQDMVNLTTGDLSYNLPVINIPGPEGGYPLSISYNSGIGTNQEASWVGLGWSLNPGSISRFVSGYPDDYRGDLVKSDYTSNEITHWSAALGVGFGPMGLSLSWEQGQGFAGVNSMSAGFAFGDYINIGVTYGEDVTYGVGFKITDEISANVSIGEKGFKISGGISQNSDAGYSVTANLSFGSYDGKSNFGSALGLAYSDGERGFFAQNVSIGFSMGSQGANGYANVGGSGQYSMTSSSQGETSVTESWSMPLPPFFSYSYSEYKWKLNDHYSEDAYGYIYQAEYHNANGNKKYERQNSDGYLYPSQDIYSASAQGISGAFQPYANEAYMLYDGPENTSKSKLYYSYPTANFGPYTDNNTYRFRFIGDNGSNFVTRDEVGSNYEGWGDNYKKLYPENTTNSPIIPSIDQTTGKIKGFTIISKDGKIYEFFQPVYNLTQFTWARETESPNPTSKVLMSTPYAVNWFITAIKGPDYCDRGTVGFDESDWGYWVKFSYEKSSEKQVWRSPYDFTGPGSSTTSESYAIGLREVVYLDYIETATHKAYFNKSISYDRKCAAESEGLAIATNKWSYNSTENKITYTFKGIWNELNQVLPSTILLTLSNYYESDPSWECYIPISERTFSIQRSACQISYDYSNECTTIKCTPPQDFFNVSQFCNNGLGNQIYSLKKSAATIDVHNLFNNSGNYLTKKLDKITLYNKSDLSNSTKSVKFNYSYSLCGMTSSSIWGNGTALEQNPTAGKLTLTSMQTFGTNEQSSIPPYYFHYSDINPNYDAHAWDSWGGYRQPGPNGTDYGMYEHKPIFNDERSETELRANNVAAWNLTKIDLPTGGSLEFEYESDDYFYVADTYNFSESVLYNGKTTLQGSKSSITTGTDSGNDFVYAGGTELDYNFKVGNTVFILNEARSATGQLLSYKFEKRLITNESPAGTFHLNQSIIFDNGGGQNNNKLFAYGNGKHFGGGVRVKQITSNPFFYADKQYTTKYDYSTLDETGKEISSGVTVTLPWTYGTKFTTASSYFLDTSEKERYPLITKFYKAFLDDKMSFQRPAQQVLYSKVTLTNFVTHIDESGWNWITEGPTNGKTIYEFNTSKDYPPNSYLSGTNQDIIINEDYSSIYGSPKKISYYENYQSNLNRILREENFYYNSFNFDNFNKLDRGSLVTDEGKRMGVIQEKFRFTNQGEYVTIEKLVDRKHYSTYLIKKSTKDYYYPDSNPSQSNGQTERIERNIQFDALTGNVVSSAVGEADKSRTQIKKIIPAYWKYCWYEGVTGMDEKNMLSQVFQEKIYSASNYINNDYSLLTYSYPNSDLISSNVSTWSYQFKVDGQGGFESDAIWRMNDKYVYDKSKSFVDFDTDSLFSLYEGYELPTVDFPWLKISNTTAYNKYSYPIEESYADGSYSSAQYNYGECLPEAIITRSRNCEFGYFSGENGWSNWESGGSTITDAQYNTGKKSAYCLNTFGPTKNFSIQVDSKTKIDKNKSYVFEGWIKRVNGNGKIVIERRDANNNVIAPNKETIINSGTDWQYISVNITPAELSIVPTNGYLRIWCGFPYEVKTSNEGFVDDLRFKPQDASMNTFTYNNSWNLTSITDNNNNTTFYEYDLNGRLEFVRDQDRKIIKKISYNFD